MSATVPAAPLTIPPDVLAFAEKQGVSAYVPAVLAMTQRLFPDALRMTIQVEQDPEIASNIYLVIEVDMAGLDVEGYVEAKWRWGEELFRILPKPLVCEILLGLNLVEP